VGCGATYASSASPSSAESGDAAVVATECAGGGREEGETERLREVRIQRALDMDLCSVRSFDPYKYMPNWVFVPA
jgi:hypothetical protein